MTIQTPPDTERMTREQRDKAVAIAKDIIAQLDADKARVLRYRGYVAPFDNFTARLKRDSRLKEHCDSIQEGCSTCWLGQAVLSMARLYDAVSTGEIMSGNIIFLTRGKTVNILRPVFDPLTINLMESAFEGTVCGNSYGLPDHERQMLRDAASRWNTIASPSERARAIAENIIANDGLFVPVPMPDGDDD